MSGETRRGKRVMSPTSKRLSLPGSRDARRRIKPTGGAFSFFSSRENVGRYLRPSSPSALLWIAFVALLSFSVLAVGGHLSFATAQTRPQPQVAQEEQLRVARISFLLGEVSHQRRRDSAKDWDNAAINLPIEESDQLLTGDQARLEIDWGGRNFLRLAAKSHLQIDQWRSGDLGLALPLGTLSFSLAAARRDPAQQSPKLPGSRTEPDEALPWTVEISTPAAAITLREPGDYRVTVREDRGVEVIVRQGRAEAYRQELGTIAIAEGRRLTLTGTTPVSLQLGDAPELDDWDRWHQQRTAEILARGEASSSLRYLAPDRGAGGLQDEGADSGPSAASSAFALAGLDDLDRYGTWQQVADHGWIWAPRFVGAGWAPYRLGDWRWYGARGWTWVSYEPWGWLPYHYGRWAMYQNRWFWFPRGDFGFGWRGWRWSPHQVAFFGWGDRYALGYRDGFWDGYGRGYRDGRGWIGWCPLAPGESLSPSSSPPPRSIAQLRNAAQPGGISGLESRRFTQGRVVQITGALQVPPAGQVGSRGREIFSPLLDTREIGPDPRRTPSRTALVEQGEVARRLANPNTILIRREDSLVRPSPSLSRPGIESRVPAREATRIEGGVVVRPSGPTRTYPPTRTDRQIERTDRLDRSESRPIPSRTYPPTRTDREIERIDRLDRLERTPRPLESSPRWSDRSESRPIPSRPSRTYEPLPRTSSPVERRPPARPDWGRPSVPESRPPSPSRSAPSPSRPADRPAPRVIERSTPLDRPGPAPERSAPAAPARPERPSRPSPESHP
jgi:hypothetical protein